MLRTHFLFACAAIVVAVSVAMTYDTPELRTLADTAENTVTEVQDGTGGSSDLADPCLALTEQCSACHHSQEYCNMKRSCVWDPTLTDKCRTCSILPCTEEAVSPDPKKVTKQEIYHP